MANFYLGDIVEAERRESKKPEDKSKPQSQPKYVHIPWYLEQSCNAWVHMILVLLPPDLCHIT